MKYSEEEYLKQIKKLYNGEVEIISHFKGLQYPILVKDKYGVMRLKAAKYVLDSKPSIKAALNKTEYFMNHLRDKYPEIAKLVSPQTEYITAKGQMLFLTKYGLVKSTPDALLAGHVPSIKTAINRKEYFRNLLLILYDYKYDFEITSTSRHHGRVTLICPIHGKQSIDSDTIFMGCGCPECNKSWEKSNVFYLIKLHNTEESFYKLGISYIKNNEIRRYSDYRKLGYIVTPIKTITFSEFVQAKEFETSVKLLIKNNLYTPKNWEANSSTECFKEDLLQIILDKLKYDIVSTSTEMLSGLYDEQELTTLAEENAL